MTNYFKHIVSSSGASKAKIRGSVSSHIKHFDVSEFSINKELFIKSLAISFEQLPFDYYDVGFKIENQIKKDHPEVYANCISDWLILWNRIGRRNEDKNLMIEFWRNQSIDNNTLTKLQSFYPHRKRSCFQYLSYPSKIKNNWAIEELGVPKYEQKVDDTRSRTRIWSSPNPNIIRNEYVLKLIAIFSDILSNNISVRHKKFKFTFHQMLTYAKGGEGNKPAPEGTHQDGVDYIISAVVVERKNITGGVSTIYYAENKLPAITSTLQPGQGIFQADMHYNLWHGISPIYKINIDSIGYRSIIGFDIEFVN